MKKVVKFGGSSLASASQFEKVGAIIRGDESRRYVVPSAPGKRFSGDTKVTENRLPGADGTTYLLRQANGFPVIQRSRIYYMPAIAVWEMRKNSRRS